MNLLDMHAKNLKISVNAFGRTVTLTDLDGNEYTDLKCIWNDVEHALKVENFDNAPMGAKSSVYFDTDSLSIAGITPDKGWKLTGSPNDYTASADYYIEIPKDDLQLPGNLFFLSKDKGATAGWDKVD